MYLCTGGFHPGHHVNILSLYFCEPIRSDGFHLGEGEPAGGHGRSASSLVFLLFCFFCFFVCALCVCVVCVRARAYAYACVVNSFNRTGRTCWSNRKTQVSMQPTARAHIIYTQIHVRSVGNSAYPYALRAQLVWRMACINRFECLADPGAKYIGSSLQW